MEEEEGWKEEAEGWREEVAEMEHYQQEEVECCDGTVRSS